MTLMPTVVCFEPRTRGIDRLSASHGYEVRSTPFLR